MISNRVPGGEAEERQDRQHRPLTPEEQDRLPYPSPPTPWGPRW